MMEEIFKDIAPTADINYIVVAALVAAAYLIGNISPAILIAKSQGIDIKKEGSGNAGTTNMLRVIGKKAAVVTLIIDILKGVTAVLLGRYISGEFAAMLCVIAVFAGHVWPVFYKFKGGKGVATLFGGITAFNWAMGLTALGIVAIGVLISRRMSVGSMIGAATFPIVAYFYEPGFLVAGILVAILVLWKHRANIVRLCKGEEPKMNFSK